MPTCVGCYRGFTNKGYALHLEQTTSPQCRLLHQRMQEELGWDDLEDSVGPATGGEFEGDYFGQDYGPQDLPGVYEDSTHDEPSPVEYLGEELVGIDEEESEDDDIEDTVSEDG